jgi:hypothetical protein
VSGKEVMMTWTVERALRFLAGTVVLMSVGLGYALDTRWYLLTGFVGLNLLQSAFTNWCPAMSVFRKLGLREDVARAHSA